MPNRVGWWNWRRGRLRATAENEQHASKSGDKRHDTNETEHDTPPIGVDIAWRGRQIFGND